MKKLLTLLLCAVPFFAQAFVTLHGKITDKETGEELIAANVSFHQNGKLVHGITTDFNGDYRIYLSTGTYDIIVSYIGYDSSRTNGVVLSPGVQSKEFNVELSICKDINLAEIVVTDYKVPLVKQDNTTQGAIVTGSQIAVKNIQSVAAATAGMSQRNNNSNAPSNNSANTSTQHTTPSSAAAQTESKPTAGQLTAGEWKDLDNWSFWQKLMDNEHFKRYCNNWGFHPDQRFDLKIVDQNSRPVANIKVNLLDADEVVVWSALTDNKGAVSLWGNMYNGKNGEFKLQIITSENETTLPAIPYSEGLNQHQLSSNCSTSNQVDVAFVVDVTGSMSDEIRYLKSEIRDVIDRAESEEQELALRTAAVYYAAQNQLNLLNHSPLSENKEETISFINNTPTGGGGVEIVEAGLRIAIKELDWNPEAIARVIFILLDEPPANNELVRTELHQLIEEAAKKGIKVIPVASSGINKPTEFLLKLFAMSTNGTYTFLTNHSGIGNNHIAPEAGDYNVETLNDLMVRLITESSEYYQCNDDIIPVESLAKKKKIKRKEKRKAVHIELASQIQYFPNPAVDFVNIQIEKPIDLLMVINNNGQIITQYPKMKAGDFRLNTSSWVSGTYFLHFHKNGTHVIKKLIVGNKS
ncbi:MAG: carboxypeptidase regulatory-like domain-containing protein [Saprospiraceae bacterium]